MGRRTIHQEVSSPFRLPDIPAYPQGNTPPFEQWFYENHTPKEGQRSLIPVWWTSYYRQNKYGKNQMAMANLNSFLRSLDANKKWFTIVQYDDGILNNLNHLDVKVFAMSGLKYSHAIPLVCQPWKVLSNKSRQRKYLASFVGSNTHPIRRTMIDYFQDKPDVYIHEGHLKNQNEYHQILADSVYALCPRGYGQTSFRIMEAVRQSAIPVYISNCFMHELPKGIMWSSPNPMHLLYEKMKHEPPLFEITENDFSSFYSFEAVKKDIESKIGLD